MNNNPFDQFDHLPQVAKPTGTFGGLGETIKENFKIGAKGLGMLALDHVPTDAEIAASNTKEQSLFDNFAAKQGTPEADAALKAYIEKDGVIGNGGHLLHGVFDLFSGNKQTADELVDTSKQALKESIHQSEQHIAQHTPDDLGIFQKGVRGAIDSGARMIPGIGLEIAARGKLKGMGMTSLAGGQTYSDSYGKARANDKSPEQAHDYAKVDALLEMGGEAVPAMIFVGLFKKQGEGALKQAIKRMVVADIAGEQVTTLGQSLNALDHGLDQELENAETLQEKLAIQGERQAVAAVSAALLSGTLGGVGVAAQKLQGQPPNDDSHGDAAVNPHNPNLPAQLPISPTPETTTQTQSSPNPPNEQPTSNHPPATAKAHSIGNLIAQHEGDYGSYNQGRAGDAGGKQIDFSRMTIAELLQRQALPKGHSNRLFAVGKYQIIPSTMKGAVKALGLSGNERLTPELQERIFRDYLFGQKRPLLKGFVTGEHNNLNHAVKAGSREWASIENPDTGKSYYAGSGNNKAATSAKKFGAALLAARQAYDSAINQGMNKDAAYRYALGHANPVNQTSSIVSDPLALPSPSNQRPSVDDLLALPNPSNQHSSVDDLLALPNPSNQHSSVDDLLALPSPSQAPHVIDDVLALPNQGQAPQQSVNDVLALPDQTPQQSVDTLLTVPQSPPAVIHKPLPNEPMTPELPAPMQITGQAINTLPQLTAPIMPKMPEFDGRIVNTTPINTVNPNTKREAIPLPQHRKPSSETISPQTQAIAQATTQAQTTSEHQPDHQALPMASLLQMKQTLETQLAKDNALFAQQQCQ
jgi:hypothetical protein